MRYDTIIIGAGLSGLTCALLLARHGRRVVVVEQHPVPAPVVRGFSRCGHYFDTGFHYAGGLGDGGGFAPLLRHLGLLDQLELVPYAADGFDCVRIISTGEDIGLPVGYQAIADNLSQRFPHLGSEILSYLQDLEQGWSHFPYLSADVPLNSFSTPMVHGESLAERLRIFSDHPELQSLFSMHSLLYGVPATQAPLSLNRQVAGSYYHSVHGVQGGGRALIAGFLELLEAAGVDFRCGQQVAAINVAAAGVTGVTLADGEQVVGKEVVATCNPAMVPGLLPEGAVRPVYRKRLTGLKQTSSAFLLFATVTGGAQLLTGRNLFVQQQPGVFATGSTVALEQRSMYLTLTETAHGKSSLVAIIPADFSEVSAYADAGHGRKAGYAEFKQQVTETLLNYIRMTCPELTGLQAISLATPLTLRDYSVAPEGAIYGAGHFIGQYNPQAQTRIPGLLLSGQGTAAPGFLGGVVAAYLTAGSLVGHDLLLKEVRLCR